MGFADKLRAAAERHRSWLCLGLDPDPDRLPWPVRVREPSEAIAAFNTEIIEATKDLVCAYQPNSAFYEALGPPGLHALQATCEAIPTDIPLILDAKRGDTAHAARRYARAAFAAYGADAVTLHPYLGRDALVPFLEDWAGGVFLLARTSNAGARALQDLACDGRPLYARIAELAAEWRRDLPPDAEIGLIAGASSASELAEIRATVGPEMPLLISDIRAQDDSLEEAFQAGANAEGAHAVLSLGPSVLYAEDGPGFAQKARADVERLRERLHEAGG